MKKNIVFLLILVMAVLTGCTKNVKDEAITVSVQDKNYEGTYTGVLKDGIPTGVGEFKYKKDKDYITYKGDFEDGKLGAKGAIDTNLLMTKVKGEPGGGHYSGDFMNGIAKGKGTFEGEVEGTKFTYRGAWDNGNMNGEGVFYYEREGGPEMQYIGNFSEGDYKPSIKDCVYTLTTWVEEKYTILEESKKFLEAHEDLFPVDNYEKISEFVDTSIDETALPEVSKIGLNNLVKIDCVILEKEDTEFYNDLVLLTVKDEAGEAYSIEYYGKLSYNIGDAISLYGLPLGGALDSEGNMKKTILASYIKHYQSGDSGNTKVRMTAADEEAIQTAVAIYFKMDSTLEDSKMTYWIEKDGSSNKIVLNVVKPEKDIPSDFKMFLLDGISGALSTMPMSVEYSKVEINFIEGTKTYNTYTIDAYKG